MPYNSNVMGSELSFLRDYTTIFWEIVETGKVSREASRSFVGSTRVRKTPVVFPRTSFSCDRLCIRHPSALRPGVAGTAVTP